MLVVFLIKPEDKLDKEVPLIFETIGALDVPDKSPDNLIRPFVV